MTIEHGPKGIGVDNGVVQLMLFIPWPNYDNEINMVCLFTATTYNMCTFLPLVQASAGVANWRHMDLLFLSMAIADFLLSCAAKPYG